MITVSWRLFLLVILFLGASLRILAQAALPPWPYTASGLSPAKEWVWGRLDNGLRYVVRKNALPAGHISLRLCVQVGFASETKEERGFAHFVEHMAFNGTTHFPAETLVPELRKHGVDIGPELSAFTFLTHTIYNFDAPSTAPVDLERWFTVLRDFADGLLFDSREVKRQRGVIASELRDRDSPGTRSDSIRRRFLYPLSPLSNSLAGDVENADRKKLKQFYRRWYTPGRMILVAVGDAEPAQLEALVHRYFASLPASSTAEPDFDPGFVDNPFVGTTLLEHDPKVSGLSVEVTSVQPNDQPDSVAQRRRWTARNLLIYLLNVRLQQVVRYNPERLYSLTAHSLISTPYTIETSIGFTAPSTEWKFATTTVEQELRRSFEYTFTKDEMGEARESMLKAGEQQVKASATSLSTDLAGYVLQQALWRIASISPEDELSLTRDFVAGINAIEMNRDWRSLWAERRARIFGYGYFPVPDATALITDAFHESGRHPIAAPVTKRELPFAYTDFGPSGTIVHREYLPDLDIHLLQFANGVRVNLKRTTFEAATVYLTARLGHGMLAEPATQPGLGTMTAASYLNGGLKRHPPEELRRILSASSLELNFSSAEDSFAFTGHSSSATLERLLQLLAAELTDPGWDHEAFALAAAQLSTYSHDLNHSPEGVIALNGFRQLSSNDSRYMMATVEQLKARTPDELKQWLGPQLRSAPLEIGLVGDFDLQQTESMLSRTVGALPLREEATVVERPVIFAKRATAHQFGFKGENNRAGIEVAWPLDHCDDTKITRETEVLSALFSARLFQKVRQELGAAYTPEMSYWKSEANPNDGYLLAYISVKPEVAKRLTKLVVELADTLSRKGATSDEFDQARAPILARADTDLKQNSYWLTHIVPIIQSKPGVRLLPLTRISDLQGMTLSDINALAGSVFPASRATVFSALPERD